MLPDDADGPNLNLERRNAGALNRISKRPLDICIIVKIITDVYEDTYMYTYKSHRHT